MADVGIDLVFPAPGIPLSINKANRMHWAAKKRDLDPWREAVGWAWLQQRNYWWKVKDKPCIVEVTLPFKKEGKRRDPHNYTGTVVKAIVDALTNCGVWPDDTSDWVKVEDPVLVIGDTCMVKIVPRDKWQQ